MSSGALGKLIKDQGSLFFLTVWRRFLPTYYYIIVNIYNHFLAFIPCLESARVLVDILWQSYMLLLVHSINVTVRKEIVRV